ncbi:uncharacterized protein LOC130428215 [Triplophysa dalaica]|uniref:uncharacterized protein LOC130428215 n=1 Tax=Triplophysa dalaica TaxID=1582913 RepID=UPI0024DFAC67|nr:uncharacterized protein LOC130428215 [Triplophysa dalaica]
MRSPNIQFQDNRYNESVQNEAVDIQTLDRIINFFEQNYKRVDAKGYPLQYATAINVPKAQCQAGFNQNNFLTHENANNVKNYLANASNPVYQGQQLIAAGTIRTGKYNIHSEYLLLNPPDNSLMTNLLNRNKQDCSIFYTFNSPCLGTCLDEQGPYNILEALDKWSIHDGIKAFVFRQFWKHDTRKGLKSKFKLIASRVPLYRCVSVTECYACNGEGDAPINENCLPPPPPIIRHRSEL